MTSSTFNSMAGDTTDDSITKLMTLPCKTLVSIITHILAFAFLFANFFGTLGLGGAFYGGFIAIWLAVFFATVVYFTRIILFMIPATGSWKSRKSALILDIVTAALIVLAIVLQFLMFLIYMSRTDLGFDLSWMHFFGHSQIWFALVSLIIGIVVDILDAKGGGA